MSHAAPSLPAPAASSVFGRVLAGAQVVKETWSAVLLVLPVLLVRPWVLATSLPTVILFGLHGALALGWLRRRVAVLVWVLTLIEEVWTWLLREMATTSATRQYFARVSFGLGLSISVLALAELAWRWQRRRTAARRNVHHHARTAGRRA
jgi:toxin CptA